MSEDEAKCTCKKEPLIDDDGDFVGYKFVHSKDCPQIQEMLADARCRNIAMMWEEAFKVQCPRCRDGEPLIGRLHLDTFNGNKNLCSAAALRARAEQEVKA